MEVGKDQTDVYGKTFSFKLTANFKNLLETTQSFKILFAKKPEDKVEVKTKDEVKPVQPPGSPQNISSTDVEPTDATEEDTGDVIDTS